MKVHSCKHAQNMVRTNTTDSLLQQTTDYSRKAPYLDNPFLLTLSEPIDASRRGKKGLKPSRNKNARHEPSGGRAEKRLLRDPGSELRLVIWRRK